MSIGARSIYVDIHSLSQKTGECWASNKYFASQYNVSVSTIKKWIGELREHGYIYCKYDHDGAYNELVRKITPNPEFVVSNKDIYDYENDYYMELYC